MWFPRSRPTRHSSLAPPSRKACRLRLEPLEDRSLLSAGALDPTFGSGGIVFKDYGLIDPGAGSAGVRALYTYPASDPMNAGKILGAGYVGITNVTHTGLDFAVMRFNPDGTPDTTFGTSGVVTTDFTTRPDRYGFGMEDVGYGLAVDTSGRIVVVGSARHEVPLSSTSSALVADFAIARYTPTGQLDMDPATGFGPLDPTSGLRAGKLKTVFPGSGNGGSIARAVAIQPDGQVVVGGYVYTAAGNHDFALARYGDDGSLDATFGSGGLVTAPVLAGNDYARAMLLQADGKIVLAGSASNASDLDFAAARFHTDGTLDITFGSGGKVTTPLAVKAPTSKKRNAPAPPAADDDVAGLVQDASGRYVLAGYTVNTSTGQKDTALVRYTAAGALDTGFGSGGKVVTNLGGNDWARALALQPDGKLVVGGSAVNSTSGDDFVLARYNPNGTLDPSFGANGKVVTVITSGTDDIMALTLQPDGIVVAGGFSSRGFAVVRYLGDPPAAPANLGAVAVSSDQVDLTWTASGTATAYVVERSTDGVTFTAVATVSGSSTSYPDAGLSAATRYVYRVRALNANGTSVPSPLAEALTPPLPD